MIDNSTKDKLENENPHFGNTLLCAVIDWDDITQRLNKSGSEPITGDPNKMDFATYKKWRQQNE